MEIIKNITEVSDVYFDNEWDTYDGYCIETDSRQLYFVINNGQDCCENWGYLSSKDALSMELMNEVLNAYAKADFRFAHALNVFQGLIDKAPTVEERKHGHWEDIDLDTSICSVCKKPQEYETKYCPECGAWMVNKL